jgi:hypothetical protein
MFTRKINKFHFLLLNITLICIFSLIYKSYGNTKHFIFLIKNQKHMTFTDALYFSINTYVTTGNNDVYPKTKFMKNIIIVQLLLLIVSIIMITSKFIL